MNFNEKIDRTRSEAATAVDSHTRQLDAIRANLSLSDSGRAVEIARVTLRTRSQIAALRDREAALWIERQAGAEALVFHTALATSAETMVTRDANDRAARLADSADALAALERARVEGDRALADAIGRESVRKGWGVVEQSWVSDNAERAAALEELRATQDARSDGFVMAMHYNVMTPNELRGYSDEEMVTLAS